MHTIRTIFIVIFSSLILAGCVHSNGATTAAIKHPDINYEFLGVPILFQGYGTSVPISNELSLTAAHVASLSYNKVIAYHPQCDIALIQSDNTLDSLSPRGLVFPGESVKAFGMDATGDVITSDGIYHLDLNFVNDKNYAECPASITDAAIQGGMSGGGAYNEKGELVGILTGIADKRDTRLLSGEPLDIERLSIFVPTQFLEPWLNEHMTRYYRENVSVAQSTIPKKTIKTLPEKKQLK
ncbi:serine protease [Vibrio sp. ZSDE26]|uniref:Serine protease n=1 Tax=Vibrio amylolyticus TaxID=2847292 RepID=A0A9X1XHN6_9VIBR|nr:serine protease [Vibrio amylolyticus]MCK6263192.1 serine protease [Vibrio amylolyticus]